MAAGHQFIGDVVNALAAAGEKKKRGKDPIAAVAWAGAPIGESTGSGFGSSVAASGSGGGLTSPFTETDVGRREYHPAEELYNEDGTLVKIYPIKKLIMLDVNGYEEVRNFGIPDYASVTA